MTTPATPQVHTGPLAFLRGYFDRLGDVLEHLWICSYPLIGALALNILVPRTSQGAEINFELNTVLSDLFKPGAGLGLRILSFTLTVVAVLYCALCFSVASSVALRSRPGSIASTVPFWLGLLCIISSAGVVVGPVGVNVITVVVGVVFFLMPVWRQFGGRLIAVHQFFKANARSLCITLGLIGLAVFVATLVSHVAVPRSLTTWAVVYTGIGWWTLCGTLLFIALPRYRRLPSFWLLPIALAFVFSNFNDNHRINVHQDLPREFQDEKQGLTDAEQAQYAKKVTDAFDRRVASWVTSNCPAGGRCDIGFVAAEGGGLRAAFWTAEVLSKRNFPRVFAVSTVSGGSFGAVAYYSAVGNCKTTRAECLNGMLGVVSDDHLSPILSGLVFANALQWLLPVRIEALDRARWFEDGWARSWHDFMHDGRFAEPFPPPHGDGPEFFVNSTNVESGKRFVISSLLLPPANRREAYYAFDEHVPYRIDSLPTSTALHLSSRFAYVSPHGTLPGLAPGGDAPSEVVWGRLIDGGYHDNTGLTTLFEVIAAVDESMKRCAERPEPPGSRCRDPHFSLYYISNNPASRDVVDDPSEPSDPPRRPLSSGRLPAASEIGTPIDGFVDGRAAAELGAQRYKAQEFKERHNSFCILSLAHLARLAQAAAENHGAKRDEFKTYYEDRKPALGWWLSKNSRDEMDRLSDDAKCEPTKLT